MTVSIAQSLRKQYHLVHCACSWSATFSIWSVLSKQNDPHALTVYEKQSDIWFDRFANEPDRTLSGSPNNFKICHVLIYWTNFKCQSCQTLFNAYYQNTKSLILLLTLFSGPFFHHYMPMDTMRGNEFSDTKTRNTVYGRPSLVAGKIGRCASLDGRRDYIDLGDQVGRLNSMAWLCYHAFWTMCRCLK